MLLEAQENNKKIRDADLQQRITNQLSSVVTEQQLAESALGMLMEKITLNADSVKEEEEEKLNDDASRQAVADLQSGFERYVK